MARTEYSVSRELQRREGCACDADGFRRVGPLYATDTHPGDLDAMHAALVALANDVTAGRATMADYERDLAAYNWTEYHQLVAAESVFPCPFCKPEQYRRWQNGCYELNHHSRSCDVCGPKDKANR